MSKQKKAGSSGRARRDARPGNEAEAAELARMLTSLNEVQMRLDALLRKLSESAGRVGGATRDVQEFERLRVRLLGKIDRARERIVDNLRPLRRRSSGR